MLYWEVNLDFIGNNTSAVVKFHWDFVKLQMDCFAPNIFDNLIR